MADKSIGIINLLSSGLRYIGNKNEIKSTNGAKIEYY